MVILHIITGLNDGGAEAALYRLCKANKNNKHYVVSLMGYGKYGFMLEENGVLVHSLDMPQGRVTLKGLIKLFKIMRKISPDAIQTWMYHADLIGGVIARIAGISNISWGIHHSNLAKGDAKISTIFVARICSFFSYLIPKNIICCANKAYKVHSELGYCKRKLKVIYNGYDLDTFSINQKSRRLIDNEFNLSKEIDLLGMVSRFHPFKDHHNLVKSLGKLKKVNKTFKFLLVGEGMTNKNKTLIRWIDENNVVDNVILAGSRDDIPHIMNAIDLHVLSSSSEAFPNVLNEAMACGTPCVSTDVGDASLILGHTGWVVPPKNPTMLAKGILLALEVKDTCFNDWSKRKRESRIRVEENFSIKSMVKKYEKTWNDEKT